MAYTVKRYKFKDGKVMFEDRIAYANAFHLFVGCSDHFMSGIEIEDIKFCPICGRKLV